MEIVSVMWFLLGVQVLWAKQQVIKSRAKRDYLPLSDEDSYYNLNDPRWQQMWYLVRIFTFKLGLFILQNGYK